MQPQQQNVVVTGVQPMYVAQPFQTATVVNSYNAGQSQIIGLLLIIAGCLSIIFNIVDLAIGTQYYTRYISLSSYSNGALGHGIWCGIMVSVPFHVYTTLFHHKIWQ